MKKITWKWSKLNYWSTGEWQVVKEKLNDERKAGYVICPERRSLFAALKATPYDRCRCCIIGQDPYPNRQFATGISFSIPEGQKELPPSLVNLYTELVDDIGCPFPTSGDLSCWCLQGVLLWNGYPSCREGVAGSHHWDEWTYLTREIVEKLDEKPPGQLVYILLGNHARSYNRYIRSHPVIETSHPSPLGAHYGFFGSRIFSRANAELELPITWSCICPKASELMSTDSMPKVTESAPSHVEIR